MKLCEIKLTNFRSFRENSFSFSDGLTVVLGPNATGKTNLLEAIFLLSVGKSFRARLEEEMIYYGQDLGRVSSFVPLSGISEDEQRLEVILTRGEIEIGEAKIEKVARKKLLVNAVPRRLVDFAGNLKVVLFGPWDLELVTQSPAKRRFFLDTVLSQVDWEYRRAILSYEKGLRQRNKLLFMIRESFDSRSGLSGRPQLLFWDKLLVKNGNYISKMREEFIEFVNQTKPLDKQNFILEYDKSAISEGRLAEYAVEEVAAATTMVGPHRDDIIIRSSEARELSRFGSRGEQRMGVLWLKLAELLYIEKKVGERPVLLLDDIFSELDHEHRKVVMEVSQYQQTIVTTADPHFVEEFGKIEKIEL